MIPLIKLLVKSLEVFIRELYPVQWSPGQKTPASLHRRSWLYLSKHRPEQQPHKTITIATLKHSYYYYYYSDTMGTSITVFCRCQMNSLWKYYASTSVVEEVTVTWRCSFTQLCLAQWISVRSETTQQQHF